MSTSRRRIRKLSSTVNMRKRGRCSPKNSPPCFSVSKRRYRGGTSSATKHTADTKVLMKKVKKCSEDVSAKLKEYHNDPAGEEAFTKLMTTILTQAKDVNSKFIRTMLNNLEPKGEYKVNTLSNKEIQRVSRKMHTDRKFMKRNKFSILPWVFIIIVCIVTFSVSAVFCLLTLPGIFITQGDTQYEQYKKNAMVFLIGVTLAIFIKLSTTELKKCSQNIQKLEQIIAIH